MKPRHTIDWTQLRLAVGLRLMAEKLSVREAAQKSGLGISAISRASNEKEQSAANVLMLCRWLGLDPMNLIVPETPAPPAAPASRDRLIDGLLALLRTHDIAPAELVSAGVTRETQGETAKETEDAAS